MSEVDTLFANLSGGFAGTDPNGIAQESAIGSGQIQGTGFVQMGGMPWATFGGIQDVASAPPASGHWAANDIHLVPVFLPGLMTLTDFKLWCVVGAGGGATLEYVLMHDSGQGSIVTVVVSGSTSVAAGAMSSVILQATDTVVPPGMYWFMVRLAALNGGSTFDHGYVAVSDAHSYSSTSASSLPAVGDAFDISSLTWGTSATIPAGLLRGSVLGGALS